MRKLFLLLFAFLGVVLSSCGHDDDDVSAIYKVKLIKSSCERTNKNITIIAGVENYSTQSMECWLNVGGSSDYLDFNQIWTVFKMDYDWSKKELSTEIPSDFIKDKTSMLFGHIIVSDFVKHESIELCEPIIVYTPDPGVQDYSYKPMLEMGKVWKYDTTIGYFSKDEDLNTFYTISVVDGPDENGRFTLCKSYNDEGLGDEYLIPDSYFTWQESDKVVSSYLRKDEVRPLMDFNMKKGDKTQYSEIGYIFETTVMDDELITVKGRTYRRLYIKQEELSSSWNIDGYWIEGIGCKNLALYLTPIEVPGSWYTPGGETYYINYESECLNSVYKDGECIFECADFDTPANGIE